MTPAEAEILKYYSNTFNAVRIVFANVMYEICEKLDSDYEKVLKYADNWLYELIEAIKARYDNLKL